MEFTIELNGSVVHWEPKDGVTGPGGEMETHMTAAEVSASEKIDTTPKKDNPILEAVAGANEEAAEAEAEEAIAGVDATLPAPGKKKKIKAAGRPKRGFRIYIDAVPLGVKTTLAETLFKELSPDGYYDLDPFKRREVWHQVNFQAELGSVDVVVRNPNGSPDMKAFIEAMRAQAQAGNVIEGLS